ncbi:MAG: SU10 major capsid protein, partial [Wolinella sp.]
IYALIPLVIMMSVPNTPKLEITGFNGDSKSTKQKNTNAVQITTTELMVSETMQTVKVYGGNELAHETSKKAKEHAQKLEYQLFGLGLDTDPKVSVFKAPQTRTDTQAGQMAGLFHFAAKGATTFNSSGKRGNMHAFDASGDWSGAEQDLTWDSFNQILESIWENGGTPRDVFVGSKLKAKINAFIKDYGIKVVENGDKVYNGIINKIETDFGVVNINMHRYLSGSFGLGDVIIAGDFDYVKHGLLIPTALAWSYSTLPHFYLSFLTLSLHAPLVVARE